MEKTIPGSSYVLSALLGPLVELPKVAPAPPKVDQGLLKKKLDREKKKSKEEEKSSPAPPVEAAKQSECQEGVCVMHAGMMVFFVHGCLSYTHKNCSLGIHLEALVSPRLEKS